ncbi:hypothetical protein [Brevibacillus sp. 179-C9.3 HS]|jgi:hypothetical protein|uniref:hypothetical protein n=1 Tax=unclassified Brevibacillus TaxID=2684853 RepID=UPI00399F9AF3
MRWGDWLIVALLIVTGLSCLTMSATWMMDHDSMSVYLHNFLKICLWTGVPALIVAVIYKFLKIRQKKDD